MIEIRNVSKAYDNFEVLSNISLKIPRGKIVGLVGPNGSGKSTLLRLICGVLQSDKGFITCEEQSIYDNPKSKNKIVFVADEPYFFNNATLKDMKQFYKIFYTNFSDDLYDKALSIFSINENMKIQKMSKGMKRQVILVLSIACNGEYLLLDEAFDGLDPVMRLNLKRLLSERMEEANMSVVISSHNIRELEDICDLVYFISDGNVLSSGGIEDLKESMHKLQFVCKPYGNALDNYSILHSSSSGSIHTIITKEEVSTIKDALEPYDVTLFEELPLRLEDVFIYEMEAKGYGINKNEK